MNDNDVERRNRIMNVVLMLSVVVFVGFNIMCFVLKDQVMEIVGSTYSFNQSIMGIPFTFFIGGYHMFEKIGITYGIVVLLEMFMKQKLYMDSKNYRVLVSVLFVLLWVVLITVFVLLMMSCSNLVFLRVINWKYISFVSILYGIVLGVVTYQFVQLVKRKEL